MRACSLNRNTRVFTFFFSSNIILTCKYIYSASLLVSAYQNQNLSTINNCIQVKAVFLTVKIFSVCIRDKVLAQRLSSQGLSYPSFLQPPWDMCEREHLSKTTCFNSHTSYTLCTIDSSSEFQKSFEERKRPYFHSSVKCSEIGWKGCFENKW